MVVPVGPAVRSPEPPGVVGSSRGSTLVELARAGDNMAFEALLEPLITPGYRLALGLLHDHNAAEDPVQDAAMLAWRKIRNLREGAEMRPWFFGIVARRCRSAQRARWWSVIKLPDLIPVQRVLMRKLLKAPTCAARFSN